SGRRSRNVPNQPVGHVHLRALIQDRLRIVEQQNKALGTHGNLRPLQFGRRSHLSSLLRVFVRYHPAIFKSRCCHEQRRCLRTASATLPPPPATTRVTASASTLPFLSDSWNSAECDQSREYDQNSDDS